MKENFDAGFIGWYGLVKGWYEEAAAAIAGVSAGKAAVALAAAGRIVADVCE